MNIVETLLYGSPEFHPNQNLKILVKSSGISFIIESEGSEAVAQTCSVKKVFLEISQNS